MLTSPMSRARVKQLADTLAPVYNDHSPFKQGDHVYAESDPGASVYGAEHPGVADSTKYATERVTDATQLLYPLPGDLNAAETDADGANQLRAILLANKVPLLRVDGDTAPAAGEWSIASGGGTGVGATGIQADDDYLAGVSTIAIRHTALGTGTETILLGDILTIGGNDYIVTSDDFVFDDDTGVDISFSPPLLDAVAEDDPITISAGDGSIAILGAGQTVKAFLEWFVLDASDVATLVNSGTAGRIYNVVATSFMFADAATNLTPLSK